MGIRKRVHKGKNEKKDIITVLVIVMISSLVMGTAGLNGEEGFMPVRSLQYERAKVLEVREEEVLEDPSIDSVYSGFQELEVMILTGPFRGQETSVYNSIGRGHSIIAEAGENLIVSTMGREGSLESIDIYQYERRWGIYVLAIILCIVLILVGRKKGLMSILSLLFTGMLLFFFLVPNLLRGSQPVFIGIITAVLSITVNFYFLNGWSKKTYAAILGTSLGLIVAGTMAYLAGTVGNISGIHTENADQLMLIADETGLQFRGLLFTTILISAMGAVMDVGMSIASAAFELDLQNPAMKKKELITSSLNVGKDIIGTMTNTLILVFVGGMLSSIIVSVAYGMPYHHFINSNLVAIEITQALAGSIGLVLTVPITAFIAGHMAKAVRVAGNEE